MDHQEHLVETTSATSIAARRSDACLCPTRPGVALKDGTTANVVPVTIVGSSTLTTFHNVLVEMVLYEGTICPGCRMRVEAGHHPYNLLS